MAWEKSGLVENLLEQALTWNPKTVNLNLFTITQSKAYIIVVATASKTATPYCAHVTTVS
jgi:hypothetical protein